MTLRFLVLTPAVLVATVALGNTPSSTCQELIASVRENNSGFIGIQDIYECGPEFTHKGGRAPNAVNACLVYFETELGSSPSTVAAFNDVGNKHSVGWIAQNSGWETTGHHLCSDVKTYVKVSNNGETASVEVERSTARDAMFCPFVKLFTSYSTTCRRVVQNF